MEKIINTPNIKNYKVTTLQGQLGDFATEWWTQEDYDNWDKHVAELKKSDQYMKPITYDVSIVESPYDNNKYSSGCTLESARFDIIDFGK